MAIALSIGMPLRALAISSLLAFLCKYFASNKKTGVIEDREHPSFWKHP